MKGVHNIYNRGYGLIAFNQSGDDQSVGVVGTEQQIS